MKNDFGITDLSCDVVIDTYHKQKPELVWYVGSGILDKVRRLRDGQGKFLFGTIESKFMPQKSTLLGHRVEVVDGFDLRLVTVGGNRE